MGRRHRLRFFGIGSRFGFWLGFAAHAIDRAEAFLSPTGYRSFLGIHAEPEPGLTPATFVQKIIAAYVAEELRGRLVAVDPR